MRHLVSNTFAIFGGKPRDRAGTTTAHNRFMRRNSLLTLSVLLLAGLLVAGCAAAPAATKEGDLEARLLSEEVADGDSAADGFTRRVEVRGTLDFGATVDSPYGEGSYHGWLFTGAAGARVALDAMAVDGSDTVLMLYGPQTASGWSRARPIAVNDDFRGSTDSHLDVRLARSGTYLVIVREYWGDAGEFTLTLACSGAECRAECGASCPTGSECNRVVCIRAPCPSYCAPIDPTPAPQPGDLCADSLCGPRPRTVTIMCEDGSLGGNTGRCLRGEDLSCGWEMRACPAEVRCGARLGNTCTDAQFCDFPEAAMCGRADGTGTCRPRPEACTALYSPVCSCDGVTYSNACTAQARGVDVLHTGGC